jgi:hypothetical protein
MRPEKFRNQIMRKIFGDESEDEVEDLANDGDGIIGVNDNNHGAGDEANQNHNSPRQIPDPSTRKHAYKSNNRRRGHRLVNSSP